MHDLDVELISELYNACVEEMIPTQLTDRDAEEPPLIGQFDTESKIYERPDYANACHILKTFSSPSDAKVRIIRPLCENGIDPYTANAARGEKFNILVAICVSNEPQLVSSNPSGPTDRNCEKWQWKGVYEWIDENHPDWTAKEMLMI